MPTHRRAFTATEAVALVLFIALFAIVVSVVLSAGSRPSARHPRDASAVRGLMQGFALWSGANQDRYPLPSLVDTADATVPEQGRAKDTSANIYSLLIYNAMFPPELLISSEEASPNIKPMAAYVYKDPPAARDPAHALWDPALRADFTGAKPGNVSFAHTFPEAPGSEGAGRYGLNFIAEHAAVGNRGPRITGMGRGKSGAPVPAYGLVPGGRSLTFLIHGRRDRWEGYVGYNDNHVNFETSETPESSTYQSSDGSRPPDCLFFLEPEARNLDNFLGIYAVAGPKRKDFKTIWD